MIENSYRLAAFHAATKALSGERDPAKIEANKKRVATMARELTVDFNAKGQQTDQYSSVFLFFNPSVQGTRNFLRTYGGRSADPNAKGWNKLTAPQKFAIGMIGASTAFAAAMRQAMGEDDDGEDRWDKVPAWMKATSIVFPNFLSEDPEDRIMIPVAYGLNIFLAVGYGIESAINSTYQNIVHGSWC